MTTAKIIIKIGKAIPEPYHTKNQIHFIIVGSYDDFEVMEKKKQSWTASTGQYAAVSYYEGIQEPHQYLLFRKEQMKRSPIISY